jgi:hypothetical protein
VRAKKARIEFGIIVAALMVLTVLIVWLSSA